MKCVEMLFKDCYQPLIIISIEHEQNKSVYINLYSFMVSKIKLTLRMVRGMKIHRYKIKHIYGT